MPLTIVNKAHQANQIYPYAISLIESVRTYERTLEKVMNAYLIFLAQTRHIKQHTTSPYFGNMSIFFIYMSVRDSMLFYLRKFFFLL